MTNNIIITGASGFLGSNFLNKILKNNSNTEIISITNNSLQEDERILNLNISDAENVIKNNYDKYDVLHFATFYSKDIKDNNNIYNANIEFGNKLLGSLNSDHINRFIYTNTMFVFDSEQDNHYYTKTKKEFSETLKQYFLDRPNVYSQIYLDNSFGENDKRNKVVSQIIKAVVKNDINPVQNNQAFINLIYIDDVVNCIIEEIKNNNDIETRITSKYDVNISSIYDFLIKFSKEQIIDNELLKVIESKQLHSKNLPIVNKNLRETNIYSNLIKVFEGQLY